LQQAPPGKFADTGAPQFFLSSHRSRDGPQSRLTRHVPTNRQIPGLFLASAVIRSLALPVGRAFYLQLRPAPEMLFSGTGLFVGDVGWSIAASNTPLSKVSNAAHGNGRSIWTKGPLNREPPNGGLR